MGIQAKQSLKGTLNNAKEYVYPELEDLEVTPSTEQQHFKSDKYGYDDVTVNAVQTETLSITPSKNAQSFEGLYSTVSVSEGVDTRDANATANDIVTGKTAYVDNEKLIGTFTGIVPAGTKEITANGTYDVTGYASANVSLPSDYNAVVDVSIPFQSNQFVTQRISKLPPITLDANRTTLQQFFSGYGGLQEAPVMNTENINSFMQCFMTCDSLKVVPIYDLSSCTNLRQCFQNCTGLETLPNWDTQNVQNFYYFCQSCSNLKNVPVLDWSSATDLSSAFSRCSKLTDDSLNNILASCISATSFTGSKKLSTLGLTPTLSRVEGLSNWQAFLDAGWVLI